MEQMAEVTLVVVYQCSHRCCYLRQLSVQSCVFNYFFVVVVFVFISIEKSTPVFKTFFKFSKYKKTQSCAL